MNNGDNNNPSQQRLLVQKQPSEDEVPNATNVNQEDTNLLSQSDKQVLPKPILFLRKQKYETQAQSNSNHQKDEKKLIFKDFIQGEQHPSDTENIYAPPASGDARMVSGGAGQVSGGETPVYNYQVTSGGHHKKQFMMQKRENGGSGSQHAHHRQKRFSEQYSNNQQQIVA